MGGGSSLAFRIRGSRCFAPVFRSGAFRAPMPTEDAARAFRVFAGLLIVAGVPLVAGWWSPDEGFPIETLAFIPAVAILEHPARIRILDHLRLLPGDHFRSIARTLGLSLGETRHHLNMLLRNGLVREERHRGRCRYYATRDNGSGRNETFEKFWAYRDLRLRVLQFVQNRGKAGPSDVSVALGISRQLAGYHLLRLMEMGYLHRENGRYAVPTPVGPADRRQIPN